MAANASTAAGTSGRTPNTARKAPVPRRNKARALSTDTPHPQRSRAARFAPAIGLGLVGAALYATRNFWRNFVIDLEEEFSAAFRDGETDRENFDQTRSAGYEALKDPPQEWEMVDEMSDSSFPASDPPSFSPGTA